MAISTAAAAPSLRRDGDDTSDHDLVALVRAGDDRAFEQLYRRYHRRIAAYVQGMVHDHARAEDITQDVFMSALRRMRDTDRPIAFKPWIYEIAKNACIDQFRRSRRAEEVSYDHEEGLGSADYGKLVTTDPAPDVAVENKQSLENLCGAFGGLSETHHEILVMRELEGLSYRQIGERLGMTRPAVESTLFRARRRLTEEYEELVTGERCKRVQSIIALAQNTGLGARDGRRLARHVSYCQPCLRHARMAGIDSAALTHVSVRQKIAALLPLPAVLKRKLGGEPDVPGPDVSSLAMWSSQAATVDPSVVSSWGKAAATAATIALAGVGAGAATTPPGEARAALDAGSMLERLTRGAGTTPGEVGRAALGVGAGAGASTPAAGAGTSSGAATPLTGTPRERAARERTRSAAAPSGTSSSTAGATPVDAARTGSSDGDAAGVTRRSDPVRETLERLTGAGASGSASATSPGAGGSGAGQSTSKLRIPALLPGPSSPSTASTPSGDVTSGAGAQNPVGQAVEHTTEAVDATVDKVGDTVQNVLGGK
jgi:RNA polymerase sigma factor (sigma-70 family)